MPNRPQSFPPEVQEELKTYVYRLIDPRNGETFYVGKGKGNRVFAHLNAAAGFEGDELDAKLTTIREIRNAGLEVGHVIHRHGMDDKTAFQVEAALMDAYPRLTNIAGGTGSGDYGTMHALEILQRYAAEEAVFEDKALLINVNKSADERDSIYDATRYAWKIDIRKAKKADVVLATRRGVIIGAFVAHEWLPATPANFEGRERRPGRFGFHGEEAPPELAEKYLRKAVPSKYRRRGAANPIKYTWRS